MNARLHIPKPAVVTAVAGPALQAKLRIGEPDDAYEREADGMAEQVMRMPEPNVQRSCAACESEERVQRKCAECEEEEELQRKEAPSSSPSTAVAGGAAPTIVGDVVGGTGRPLDASVRSFMEPRFGHDFGRVRVHDGSRAAESAAAVNARAYTVGNNVVFGRGSYSPGSESGRKLIAHELTHVLQQGGGSARGGAGRRHEATNDDASRQ